MICIPMHEHYKYFICAGAVMFSSVKESNSVPCSDQKVNIVCVANETNTVDICFEPFGCHEYDRTSQRLVMVGSVELELIDVIPDPIMVLQSTFLVEGRLQFNVNVTFLRVNCSDGVSMESVTFQLSSE